MAKLNLTYTPKQTEVLFENQQARFKIIPKGRRFGITRATSHAFIEWCIDGVPSLLWVDTINGNIDRYFERYFTPALKQLSNVKWHWNQQKKILKIRNSFIDFRSADAPQSIEGFGYKKIFLNEAGIILKDDYLYSNSILPMMIDYEDSQLIAAGVPKGKFKKDGTQHKFYELWDKVEKKAPGYWGKSYSTYDNPILTVPMIQIIQDEISSKEVPQEIFAEFTESAGENPFCHGYDKSKHESIEAQFSPSRRLTISIDFNLNPFGVIFKHIWRDRIDHNWTVGEKAIENGSIPAMIDYIQNSRYRPSLSACMLTGDVGGDKRDLGQRDNASWFEQLRRGLGLSETQIVLSNNPTHSSSRADVNYVLINHPDYKINPKECPNLCRDMATVQCDAYGSIIKADRKVVSQRADFLDCERYAVHNAQRDFIRRHQNESRARIHK